MKRLPRGVHSFHVSSLLAAQRPAYKKPRLPITHAQASRSISRFIKQAGHVQVQQVVVRGRWFSYKRLCTWTLKTGLGLTAAALAYIELLAWINQDQEEEEGEGDGQEEEEEEEADDDEEEDDDEFIPDTTPEGAWFIPLGPMRKAPPAFWSASDPEWQAYVKFANDKRRIEQVRAELVEVLRNFTTTQMKVTRILGKDLQVSHRHVHLDIPRSRPPAYEQLGIEWAPEYIAILYRQRSSANATRVRHALWPEAVAVSAFATFRDILGTQVSKAKKACGLEGQEAASSVVPLSTPVSLQAGQNEAGTKGAEAVRSLSSGTQQEPVIKEKVRLNLLHFPIDLPERDENIAYGIELFKGKLAKRWKGRQPEITPAMATVFFDGVVEFSSARGMCTWDVQALYSVKESRFVQISPRLRRVRPLRQGPRG